MAAEAVRAFTALEAAEKALTEHIGSGDGAIHHLRTGLGRGFDPRVIDQLDGRVVGGIPFGPKGRWAASDPQHLIGSIKANQRSADDYERLAALADELATEEEEEEEEERTGNGTAA